MGGMGGIISGPFSFLHPCWRPRDGAREQRDVEGNPCQFPSVGVRYGGGASAWSDNLCLTLCPE